MTDKVWVEVVGDSPSAGVVADGLSIASGEKVEVSPRAARILFQLGRARLVPDPTMQDVRKRTR